MGQRNSHNKGVDQTQEATTGCPVYSVGKCSLTKNFLFYFLIIRFAFKTVSSEVHGNLFLSVNSFYHHSQWDLNCG